FGSISREKLISQLKNAVESDRQLAKPVHLTNNYEFYLDGDDYQVRSFRGILENDGNEHTFPNVSLRSASLPDDFADVRIYSRCFGRTPVAQIWPGQSGPNDQPYAMNTSKHVS